MLPRSPSVALPTRFPSVAPSRAAPADISRLAPLLLGLAALVFLGGALRAFTYAEDDVFIPMRYALNFWRGAGWTMNPGERVEGCTSPLQLALVTMLMGFLSSDRTLWACKLLGLAFGLGVLWQTRRLARAVFPHSPWIGDLAPLLLALRPAFALSMINGLETGLAALLLTSALAAYVEACRHPDRRGLPQSALLFLGAALARPEFSLTFPLLLAAAHARAPQTRSARIVLLCYVVPLALLLALRLAYYGDLLPNTFWAKHLPVSTALPLGAAYLSRFALPGGPALSLVLYGLGLLAVLRCGGPARLALPLALALHALFLLRAGGDWMRDGRFVVPLLPACAVVWLGALLSLYDLALWATRFGRPARLAAQAALAFSALCLIQQTLSRADGLAAPDAARGFAATLAPPRPLEEWRVGDPRGRLAIGRWIAAHARPGELVLTSEMGLPTVINPDVRFLDIRGLTDRTIARLSGVPRDLSGVQGEREWMDTSRPLGRYLRARRPDRVVLLWDVHQADRVGADASNDLYVPTGAFTIQCDRRPLLVATWRRRDAPRLNTP